MNDTDVIENALLARYWDLIKKERIGETPKLTSELDKIEDEIKTRRISRAFAAMLLSGATASAWWAVAMFGHIEKALVVPAIFLSIGAFAWIVWENANEIEK